MANEEIQKSTKYVVEKGSTERKLQQWKCSEGRPGRVWSFFSFFPGCLERWVFVVDRVLE